MIIDDLYERLMNNTLDSYLNTVDDRVLLNNFMTELSDQIRINNNNLFDDSIPENVKNSMRNSIANMTFVKDKVFNRVKYLQKDYRW